MEKKTMKLAWKLVRGRRVVDRRDQLKSTAGQIGDRVVVLDDGVYELVMTDEPDRTSTGCATDLVYIECS